MNFDISEWEEVSSTSLSDAMLGLHTMEAAIKPLNRKMRVTGPAYTVQIIKMTVLSFSKLFRKPRKALFWS